MAGNFLAAASSVDSDSVDSVLAASWPLACDTTVAHRHPAMHSNVACPAPTRPSFPVPKAVAVTWRRTGQVVAICLIVLDSFRPRVPTRLRQRAIDAQP